MKTIVTTALILTTVMFMGCRSQDPSEAALDGEDMMPCITPEPAQSDAASSPSQADADIPLFASDSPFEGAYSPPTEAPEKILWARSCLYEKAPDLVVEKWLTDEPDLEGKCVLIEFWATWCPPCRKSIHLLNDLHKKYGEDLVVIGISDETEEDVRRLKKPAIEYYSAIDTQHRMKDELSVRGIPHVIVLEPEGYVVWEGFPLLKGYELTHETVEKILQIAGQ